MQWELALVDGSGVLHLSGLLDERGAHRFQGAVDWAAARSSGLLVADLSRLTGWNAAGEDAIVDAAGRLPADRAPLLVCGLRERPTALLRTSAALSVIGLHADLTAALAASDQPDDIWRPGEVRDC